MNIMDYITNKPIKRRELVALTGMCDRAVREKITNERLNGNLIINMQDGKGYFITEDMDVLEKWYHAERGRAMVKLAQLKYARRILKLHGRIVK